MTNFEYYGQDESELTRLLSAATDDALHAKGCPMKLMFPPDGDWYEWLLSEYNGELPVEPLFPESPQSETAEQYNARVVTDKLEEILSFVSRVNTPFGQAVIDIIGEAIEGVKMLGGGSSA